MNRPILLAVEEELTKELFERGLLRFGQVFTLSDAARERRCCESVVIIEGSIGSREVSVVDELGYVAPEQVDDLRIDAMHASNTGWIGRMLVERDIRPVVITRRTHNSAIFAFWLLEHFRPAASHAAPLVGENFARGFGVGLFEVDDQFRPVP